MMKNIKYGWLLVVSYWLLVNLIALPALAKIPQKINLQGVLTHQDGSPYANWSGNGDFSIYNKLVGGALYWKAGSIPITTDAQGFFNLELDISTGYQIPNMTIDTAFTRALFLKIEIDGDVMQPIQPLKSVPFAITSRNLIGGIVRSGSETQTAVMGATLIGYGVQGVGQIGVIGFDKNYPLDHTGTYGLLGGNPLVAGLQPAATRQYGAYGQAGADEYGFLGYHYQMLPPPLKAGVYGRSKTNNGVYGSTTSGTGVRGISSSGIGGHFKSNSGYGLIVEKGSVGIGTNNPSQKLEVAGHISLADNQLLNVRGLQLKDWDDNTGGTDNKYRLLARDGAWQFYNGGVVVGNYGNGTWSDLSNGTLIVEGKVGIGTTNPTTKLNVVSGGVAVRAQGFTGVEGTGSYIGVIGNGNTWDFWASNAKYGNMSSIRWKKNIKLIDNALDKVLKLRGVYFDWDKEHGGEHTIGMIAEEVGKVLPEIVEFEKDGSGYTKGMDYTKLAPVLIEAIKEQQKEIETLKKKVAELERKNDNNE